jgi:hypothetical protein
MESKINVTNASAVAADFDTNYSSTAVTPAKKCISSTKSVRCSVLDAQDAPVDKICLAETMAWAVQKLTKI